MYETERDAEKEAYVLKEKCQIQSVVLKKLNLLCWDFFPLTLERLVLTKEFKYV